MKNFPKGLQPFIDVAKESKSAEQAFRKARNIKGVDPDIATWFYQEYGGDSIDMEEAFKKFFDEVNSGEYVVEGDQFPREFIKRIKYVVYEEILKDALRSRKKK